jgi:hypothetical protein
LLRLTNRFHIWHHTNQWLLSWWIFNLCCYNALVS